MFSEALNECKMINISSRNGERSKNDSIFIQLKYNESN